MASGTASSPIARPSSDVASRSARSSAAVGDRDRTDATAAQRRAGERTHRPRADDQRAPAGQRAEHRLGAVDRDRHDGGAGLVDAGVGVRALADAQRRLGQVVQHRADRAGLGRQRVRRAQLAEDLGLTDDHRVEPRGDGEHVLGGRFGEVDVEVVGQLGHRQRRVPRQDRGSPRRRPGGTARRRRTPRSRLHVDSSSTSLTDSARCSSSSVLRRSSAGTTARSSSETGAVRCDSPTTRTLIGWPPPAAQAPRPCGSRGRTGSAVPPPGRPCARRRAAGTVSTTGAKFRMLVTPAATSRSHTCLRGRRRRREHGDRDLLLGDDRRRGRRCRAPRRPRIVVPMRAGSASMSAAMRNPREANPP